MNPIHTRWARTIQTTAVTAVTAFAALGMQAALAASSAHYFDGSSQRTITLDPQWVAVITPPPAASSPGARTTAGGSAASTAAAPLVALQPASQPVARATGTLMSPVYREGNSPAGRMMALPGGVLVKLAPEWTDAQVRAWMGSKGLSVRQRMNIAGHWYVVESPAGNASLELANALQQSGEVLSASPNWWKQTTTR